MQNPILRVVTCGSVDDGKSTLIGRLLVACDSVPIDTMEAARKVRRSGSVIPVGEIDFSLLTDGLEAEREQGITIDVAYRSLTLNNGRRIILADSPGHEQYTRNMAVAASRAQLGLVLVDVVRGIRPQTLRHLMICSLMGIDSVIIAMNKMDAVEYSENRFAELVAELQTHLSRFTFHQVHFIPLSALAGENITEPSSNMSWFQGPTLFDALNAETAQKESVTSSRMTVTYLNRSLDFRGISGTVIDGAFEVGEEVIVLPALKRAKIAEIVSFDGKLSRALPGDATTMVLEPDVDVTRGDVIESALNHSTPANRFVADIVWLGEKPLIHSRSYFLMNGATQVPAIVMHIKHRVNVTSGSQEAAVELAMNEIGRVDIATDSPIALKHYSESRMGGNFILVDRQTMETVGAGMVVHTLRRADNITEFHYQVNREIRSAAKSQKPKVYWLTGLSGSGKSTIASEFEKMLTAQGFHTYVLDGDNLRLGLNKDLGFTREDRAENVRRVSEVAYAMWDAGLIVIVALVSPFEVDRNQARSLFPAGDFLEVWVNTSAEVCASRDSKGLYSKAASGLLPNLSGIGQEYEPPQHPDLVLDGQGPLVESVLQLCEHFSHSQQ